MEVIEIIGQEVAPLQSLPGPHGLIDIYNHCVFGPTTETENTPTEAAEATAGHYTARRRSTHAHQFLQRTQLVIRLSAKEDWPIGIGDFGDIDVAARIQRDAVGGDELA